jgi:hypothetical protein
MATSAQIHANRLNARRSTGPRSDEGKAASRIEAQVLQVLLAGQDPAAHSRLGAFLASEAQRIFRRLAATERSYCCALKELRRIQRERKAREEHAATEPAAAPSLAPVPPAEPPIGFVLPIRVHPVLQVPWTNRPPHVFAESHAG